MTSLVRNALTVAGCILALAAIFIPIQIFFNTDLKNDMKTIKTELREEMKTNKTELQGQMKTNKTELREQMKTNKTELREQMLANKTELQISMQTNKTELQTLMQTNKTELRNDIFLLRGEINDAFKQANHTQPKASISNTKTTTRPEKLDDVTIITLNN